MSADFPVLQPHKRRTAYTPQQAEDIKRRRLATIAERYGRFMGGHAAPQIRMIITPWMRDEHGNPTRFIRAAE